MSTNETPSKLRDAGELFNQIEPAIRNAINELEIAARQISDIQSSDVEVVMALHEFNCTLCDHVKLLRNEMASLSASPALAQTAWGDEVDWATKASRTRGERDD